MDDEQRLVRVSPYRPVPAVPERPPRQTWWARFTTIRRWLGGTWELRWHSCAVVPLEYTQWVRVDEPSEPSAWHEGVEWITVLAVERDGHVSWAPAHVVFDRHVKSWNRKGVRQRLGGRWELWTHLWGTPQTCRALGCRRWVPVNAFTFVEQRRLHDDFVVVRREHYFEGRVLTNDADGEPLPDNGPELDEITRIIAAGGSRTMAQALYDWLERRPGT